MASVRIAAMCHKQTIRPDMIFGKGRSTFLEPVFSSYLRELTSAPRDYDLQWKVVNDFVPRVGDDECVAEENAEKTVWRDRIGFRHDHHAGLQHLLEFFGGDVLCDDMRLVGDEVNGVALGWPRLVALITKEFAREAHGFHWRSRRDLGNDAPITGERDFVPEVFHHFSGLTHADG